MRNSASRLHLHRRNDAAVYYGVFEGKCRSVVALLGFGTVVFAFSNRLCLFPRQITGSPKKLLDICDRWSLIGFNSFQRIEERWWFDTRIMFVDLVGDMSRHLLYSLDPS